MCFWSTQEAYSLLAKAAVYGMAFKGRTARRSAKECAAGFVCESNKTISERLSWRSLAERYLLVLQHGTRPAAPCNSLASAGRGAKPWFARACPPNNRLRPEVHEVDTKPGNLLPCSSLLQPLDAFLEDSLFAELAAEGSSSSRGGASTCSSTL